MNDWNEWEVIRRQVAVAGRVVDEHDKPVAGAQVSIAMLQEKPRAKRSTAKTDQQKLDAPEDHTLTDTNGIFFFLDLPAGKYSVECVNRRSGLGDKKTVSVLWKQDGSVERVSANLKLLRLKGEDSKVLFKES